MKCLVQMKETLTKNSRVCDICHGGVDQYVCCSVACGEVTQGNSFKVKGATNCCSYHKTTACGEIEGTGWAVLSKHKIETKCLAFLAPTLEIPSFYE